MMISCLQRRLTKPCIARSLPLSLLIRIWHIVRASHAWLLTFSREIEDVVINGPSVVWLGNGADGPKLRRLRKTTRTN
jgi:hypothetical protein